MPTALPAASVATGSAATEGDVKNWLTQVHDFLAGLLGTSGLPADAQAALGVGSVTYAAILAALGYTPAKIGSGYAIDAVFTQGGTTGDINVYSNYGEGFYIQVNPSVLASGICYSTTTIFVTSTYQLTTVYASHTLFRVRKL